MGIYDNQSSSENLKTYSYFTYSTSLQYSFIFAWCGTGSREFMRFMNGHSENHKE